MQRFPQGREFVVNLMTGEYRGGHFSRPDAPWRVFAQCRWLTETTVSDTLAAIVCAHEIRGSHARRGVRAKQCQESCVRSTRSAGSRRMPAARPCWAWRLPRLRFGRSGSRAAGDPGSDRVLLSVPGFAAPLVASHVYSGPRLVYAVVFPPIIGGC